MAEESANDLTWDVPGCDVDIGTAEAGDANIISPADAVITPATRAPAIRDIFTRVSFQHWP
jgi:hypothetical protein